MTTVSTEPAASGLPKCLESATGAEQQLDRISTRTTGQAQKEATATVEAIIERVRFEGDRALVALTEQFDGFRPEPLRVPAIELKQAWDNSPANLRDALDLAHRRIQDFHQRQKPRDLDVQGIHGERLGRRWRPVQAAGLYIPGGRASYPSTVLMNAVPARAAGVKKLVMVTPAGRNGQVNRTVLAAAHLAGVQEVYRIGGAQAVAALALGTETIPRVDVISGPGNLYVTLAKKLVYGQVGIDSLAGPSEILVIADGSANVAQVASDLLAQAEHDPLAAAILLTTSQSLANALPAELQAQLNKHPREAICRQSLGQWGLVVVCDNLETCARLSDRFAPEHLELLVERPRMLADRIQQAGAIFIGPWSPEAVGDYLAGPNHTLPTCGSARYSGALSVETFMRHTSMIEFSREALEATGGAVVELADSEGLHSHANSVKVRLD
ncbi:histidinol dehydrogenase [Synechococcus sp. BIOS-U3-1]|uniref:histidinol dehydrogenase n=1 Tax=Synechococcus sp. BIOS-U3-1 TaxID=1400865 RepID=UPI0016451208|nr:histidinol dehydrogenase [Synechococcus sp. BIOS-U3-1]QNI59732.1 histidinol dehydrogenase [Synechococcus sp. BIOS-U3-1]